MSTNAIITVKYIGGKTVACKFYMHSNCHLEALLPKLQEILKRPVDMAPSPCKVAPLLMHHLYEGTSRMKIVSIDHTPDSSYIYDVELTCTPYHDSCPNGTPLNQLYDIKVMSSAGETTHYEGKLCDYVIPPGPTPGDDFEEHC